jgi:hypothetical protein
MHAQTGIRIATVLGAGIAVVAGFRGIQAIAGIRIARISGARISVVAWHRVSHASPGFGQARIHGTGIPVIADSGFPGTCAIVQAGVHGARVAVVTVGIGQA